MKFQFSLRFLICAIALLAVLLSLHLSLARWIHDLRRQEIRNAIIGSDLDPRRKNPILLNSEYARNLLGDEIEQLKAEREARIKAAR